MNTQTPVEEITTTETHAQTVIHLQNGKLFVNGIETSNPTHIGFAILDIAEIIPTTSTKSTLSFVSQ